MKKYNTKTPAGLYKLAKLFFIIFVISILVSGALMYLTGYVDGFTGMIGLTNFAQMMLLASIATGMTSLMFWMWGSNKETNELIERFEEWVGIGKRNKEN